MMQLDIIGTRTWQGNASKGTKGGSVLYALEPVEDAGAGFRPVEYRVSKDVADYVSDTMEELGGIVTTFTVTNFKLVTYGKDQRIEILALKLAKPAEKV